MDVFDQTGDLIDRFYLFKLGLFYLVWARFLRFSLPSGKSSALVRIYNAIPLPPWRGNYLPPSNVRFALCLPFSGFALRPKGHPPWNPQRRSFKRCCPSRPCGTAPLSSFLILSALLSPAHPPGRSSAQTVLGPGFAGSPRRTEAPVG